MKCGAIYLCICSLAFGAKDQDWLTAKVLDSVMAKTYVPSGHREGLTKIPTMAIRDSQLMLVGWEFAYVVEDTRAGASSLGGLARQALMNRHHGCRFIVGDDVKDYQDKSVLHVLDPDGKECKVEVLRQERLK
jgi:hypothetical protein